MNSNTKKPVSFLFVMDPVETLNPETETSLLLMQEIIRRGQKVYWLQTEDLMLAHDQPMGRVFPVTSVEPLRRGQGTWSNLNQFDAVLVRNDPPVNTRYLQLTLILDYLDPRVVQFNDVNALRNFNEKMLPLHWPEFTPPTLISMNAGQLERFAIKHQHIVLKPLNDCSGRGVLQLDMSEGGNNLDQIKTALAGDDGRPRFLVAQKFLPVVSRGDKRVFLVNGKPLGMVNRIPETGNFLANIHQGAGCVSTRLSAREKHIIKTIEPFLRKQGIFLAGADFIGGYLTELNITSPSAVRQINEVSGEQVQEKIVDAMITAIANKFCCERWRGLAA